MKHPAYLLLLIFLLAACAPAATAMPALTPTVGTQTPAPVVRAVLFYSPTCPHCQYVLIEVLPPLVRKYGSQLQIVGIDVLQPGGQALYQAAVARFNIERLGVPTLIVGEDVLFGSVDIPEKFPGSIEKYLARGGVDWPDIPGLAGALGTPQPAVTPTSTPPPITPTPTPIPGPLDNLARDPTGNGLAVAVLVGMLIAAVYAIFYFLRTPGAPLTALRAWAVPALCLIGIGVAGYLAHIEMTHSVAFCGPVGDCNAVQQSEYTRLFGLIPISLLGVIGYLAIMIAWAAGRHGRGRLADLAALALLAMTAFGTLFSIYLTFLEPFVIGATCAWCLTSSILMTVLLLLSVPSGKLAFTRLNLSSKNKPQGGQHAKAQK